jgi:hypothetical protein
MEGGRTGQFLAKALVLRMEGFVTHFLTKAFISKKSSKMFLA